MIRKKILQKSRKLQLYVFSLKTICNQNQILVQYNTEGGGEKEKQARIRQQNRKTFLF
jgi:hypothetical protein